MIWHNHSELKGKHAILSCSQNSWIRKTDDEFDIFLDKPSAAKEGTELHELAAMLIKKRKKLPDDGSSYSAYVNDAIDLRLDPEVPLVYSNFCFGTADAIRYSDRLKTLHIHDLKTGTTKVHMDQLMLYAALFCLEYKHKPIDISIELRIYQANEVTVYEPPSSEIENLMRLIKTRAKKAEQRLKGDYREYDIDV